MDDYRRGIEIFFGIYTIAAVSSILLNFVVFITYFLMKKRMRSRKSNLLVCLQSCVDFVVSFSTTFYAHHLNTFYDVNMYTIYESPVVYPSFFFFNYSKILAIISLFALTCKQFMALAFTPCYHLHVTSKKIMISVSFSSLLSSIPIMVYFIFDTHFTNDAFFEIYMIVKTAISLLLIIGVFILLHVTYGRIKRSLGIINGDSIIPTKTEPQHCHENKKQNRILIIFAAMCSIFTLTFLPLTIWNQIVPSVLYRELMEMYHVTCLNLTLVLLYHLSAVVNPLITMRFDIDYKDTLTKLKVRFCCKGGDVGKKSCLQTLKEI